MKCISSTTWKKNSIWNQKKYIEKTQTSGHTAHKLFSWLLLLVLHGTDLISIEARLCSFQKANTEHRAVRDRIVRVLDLIYLVQTTDYKVNSWTNSFRIRNLVLLAQEKVIVNTVNSWNLEH